ncbi:unnamed protein product [Arctogadus glacialis]
MQELGVDRDTLPGRTFAETVGRRPTDSTDSTDGRPHRDTGQHVRKDRGVPSGSRSPESFSCSFH